MHPNASIASHKDLIYDIGMHKGEDTEYYLKKGFRVIGFEADPELLKYCKSKFADAIDRKKLFIVEGAIIEPRFLKAGRQPVKFYKNINVSEWGTVSDDWARRNEMLGTKSEIIEVQAVDFESCLKQYGLPYYMKIDIEGSDLICLKVLLDFDQKPNYISIESETVNFDRLQEEINLLERLGYTGFKAVQQANISLQIPPNPPGEGMYVSYQFPSCSSGLFGRDIPGPWKSKGQILREYKRIFVLYRLFGVRSFLNRFMIGRRFIRGLSKILGRSIPGWYDTHARHSSVPA